MSFRPPKKPTLALDSNIVQDNMPLEIVPKIFIGSIHAAFNQEALRELGITHILNASRLPSTFPKQFTYLSVDIRDKDQANILSCIPASNIFIEAGVEAGGVLVHCFGGRSRSAAFITAFLMSSCGWNYDEAVGLIRRIRQVASINKGFESQLRAYYQTNFDVYVAQQVLLRDRIRMLNGIRNKTAGLDVTEGRQGFKNRESSAGRSSKSAGHKRSWGDVKSSEPEEEDDEEANIQMYREAAGADGSKEDSRGGSMTIVATELPVPSRVTIATTKAKSVDATSLLGSYGIRTVDPKSPHCRLSKPGSSSVRVIPPLRGLERGFCCSWCGVGLFCLANVIRLDIDVLQHLSGSSGGSYSESSNSSRADEKHGGGHAAGLMSPRGGAAGGGSGFDRGLKPSGLTRPGMTFKDADDEEEDEDDDDDDDIILSPAGARGFGGSRFAVSAAAGPKTPHCAPTPKGSFGGRGGRGGGFSSKAFDFDFPDAVGSGGGGLSSSHTSPGSPAGSKGVFGEDDEGVSRMQSASVGDDEVGAAVAVAAGAGFKGSEGDEMELGNTPQLSGRRPSGPRISFVSPSLSMSSSPVTMTSDGSLQSLRDSRKMMSEALRIPSFHAAVGGASGGFGGGGSGGGSPAFGSSPIPLGYGYFGGPSGAGGPLLSGRSDVEDSPRIPIPPHRQQDGFTPREVFDLPQSAEKRRWLARVSLLSDPRQGWAGGAGAPASSDTPVDSSGTKVAKMAEEDDDAMRRAFGRDKYIYTEYLEWMGDEVLSAEADSGEICCPAPACRRVLGAWTWVPTARQSHQGLLETPVIRIHKHVVHQTELPLDATPASTPRPDDISGIGGSVGVVGAAGAGLGGMSAAALSSAVHMALADRDEAK